MAQWQMRAAFRFIAQTIMARELAQSKFEREFARTQRPAALFLDLLEPFQKAADINQQISLIWPHGL